MCGFSARTVAALQALGAPFAAVDILPDPRIRQELSALSQLADDPAALRQRRARRRLRHRHRDVRERRAGRGARRRAARGAPSPRSSPPSAPGPMGIENRLSLAPLGGGSRARTLRAMSVATQPHPALRWDGRRWRSSTRRACPAPRCGWRSTGAADTAAGDPAPRRARRAAHRHRRRLRAGDGGRAPARPRHARGAAGSCCARRARPPSTSPAPSTACAPPRWRRGRSTMAARRARRGRAHPRRGGRRLGGDRRATAPTCWPARARIATHCNTGALAAGGAGHGARRDPRAARARRRATSSPARRGRCCRARG